MDKVPLYTHTCMFCFFFFLLSVELKTLKLNHLLYVRRRGFLLKRFFKLCKKQATRTARIYNKPCERTTHSTSKNHSTIKSWHNTRNYKFYIVYGCVCVCRICMCVQYGPVVNSFKRKFINSFQRIMFATSKLFFFPSFVFLTLKTWFCHYLLREFMK